MSAAAEQAGELSPSEKLFAERRMGVKLYQAANSEKEAKRLICRIPEKSKDDLLLQLLNAGHDEDLSYAIVDVQTDILSLMTAAKVREMERAIYGYESELAQIKSGQLRKDYELSA